MSKPKITITKNGPYEVSGNLPLSEETSITDQNDNPISWKKTKKFKPKKQYSLCRCGHSKNQPFCDKSHLKNNFDGTETATDKNNSSNGVTVNGPELQLHDQPNLCSSARFCDRAAGAWELTKQSNNPKAKKIAIEECANCPSGRLTLIDKKTNLPIEPKFSPSISINQDPGANCSGPIWVKGNIEIESADKTKYQTRNRVTLCRCGHSANKPFCDGSHISTKFRDQNLNAKNESS